MRIRLHYKGKRFDEAGRPKGVGSREAGSVARGSGYSGLHSRVCRGAETALHVSGVSAVRPGVKHPALYHTVSREGKTRTTYLGASLGERARGQAAAYKRLLGLLEEVSQINLTLLTGKER